MPTTSTEVFELDRSPIKSHLKDIRKNSDGFLVSTSNDPYILLPKIIITKRYNNFMSINVRYSAKSCGTKFNEAPSFLQIFWRTPSDSFSEDKSDAAPIALSRFNYLIPLGSLSKLDKHLADPVTLEFKLDIINKAQCKFNLNRVVLGAVRKF